MIYRKVDSLHIRLMITMADVKYHYKTKIDMGDQTAESDNLLEAEFISIETAQQVDNERHAIILGRKGAGKSALRLHFEKQDDKALRSASLAPEQDELDIVYNYIENNSMESFAVEPLIRVWELSVLIALIRKIYISSDEAIRSDVFKGLPKTFVSELKNMRGLVSPSKTVKVLNKLKSKKISYDNICNKIIEKINHYCNGDDLNYYALIDSVDEALHNSADTTNRNDLFGTYFEALLSMFHSAVNKERELFNGHIIIKLFLPLDIYEWTSDRHDDRLRQYKHLVNWKRQQLYEFTVRRLYHNLDPYNQHKADQIKEKDARMKAIWEAFFPWEYRYELNFGRRSSKTITVKMRDVFVDNTLLRPRDMQELIDNIERERISQGLEDCDQSIIDTAIEQNSFALEASVRREYSTVLKEIDAVMARISGSTPIISKNQLENMIGECCGHDSAAIRRALKALYESCVIGSTHVLNVSEHSRLGSGSAKFYYDFRNYNAIENSKHFVIHRAFWHALRVIT